MADASRGGAVMPDLTGWPAGVRFVELVSSRDGASQPALFSWSDSLVPRPLVIFLHQWGGNYLYQAGIAVAKWCERKEWSFAQPDFRGSNGSPGTTGSDLVISDIQDMVDYAKSHARIDADRVFLLGASGGGHAALLAAGRLPGIFRGVSAWVPITSLQEWHAQCKTSSRHGKYARDIEAACGGPPVRGSEAEAEAISRSPLTHLSSAAGTIFDLNAGLHDGHGAGAVPVSHTFHAYNLLARPEHRVAPAHMDAMTGREEVPENQRFDGRDPGYEGREVLFRKESGNVRITIFDGGHEMVTPAALSWLERNAAPT